MVGGRGFGKTDRIRLLAVIEDEIENFGYPICGTDMGDGVICQRPMDEFFDPWTFMCPWGHRMSYERLQYIRDLRKVARSERTV